MSEKIALGCPVPWFAGSSVTGAPVDLHVDAGRWVVLAFMGALQGERAQAELAALANLAPLCNESRLVIYAIFTQPPAEAGRLASLSRPSLSFLHDPEARLSAAYGAMQMPRTIVLDPMLRAIADIAWDHPSGHARLVSDTLRGLPSADESAGVPLYAPILIVPRVFDFALCDMLVALYDKLGGEDSGFMRDTGGKSQTVIDHRLKRREDLLIAAPELCQTIRQHFVARLLPAIERYFHFVPTRMDRYLVSCYDSATGGHFFRHRDNINAGAQHRRFAVSINLNHDYDGCDLVFPEFGQRRYRAPDGGAIVFSCGMLHEVTPITRGRRYAFLPFLYAEADVRLRRANNASLHEGEVAYQGDHDSLFPAMAAE